MSTPAAPVAPPKEGLGQRVKSFLRRHPILCLALLTPGIPEYLSGSSSTSLLLVNPVVFLLFLGINLAMYTPGCLLVREALLRWRKGWATAIALGAAYAVMEEGIADATIFNPNAGPVGALGSYGHFAGVNWVWVPGVFFVHIVLSLALPIVLLGLALPETRGRSLLTNRQVVGTFGILAVDTAILTAITYGALHWFDGWLVVAACLAAIAGFALLGRRLPADLASPPTATPTRSPALFFLLGVLLLPGTFLLDGIPAALGAPPVVTILVLLAFYAAAGLWFRASIGRSGNERQLIAFAAGNFVPIGVLGFVTGVHLPVILAVDAGAIWLLLHLWRTYPPVPVPASVPVATLA